MIYDYKYDDNYITETVGSFNAGLNENNFDAIFETAYNEIMATHDLDVTQDTKAILSNKAALEDYKNALISGITEAVFADTDDATYDERHNQVKEQVSVLFDNSVAELIKESKVETLLPITAVTFPVIVKQHLKSVLKDILQTEVSKKPVVKKYIEQTIIKSSDDPSKYWLYPQAFFNKDDVEDIYNAGKGAKINPGFDSKAELTTANTGFGTLTDDLVAEYDNKFYKVTKLPCMQYDVIQQLVPAANLTGLDKFTFDLQITKVQVAYTSGNDTAYAIVPLREGININMADSLWQNGGRIQLEVTNPTDNSKETITASIHGGVDFLTGTTDINAGSVGGTGTITGVVIEGYVNNDTNMRATEFDYIRKNKEWKIEDGSRVQYSASVEELEDIKSLSDIDMFKKTYNDMTRFLVDLEDGKGLNWLDDMFEKYNGIQINPLGFDGFAQEETFSLSPVGVSTENPADYIPKMLKFKIDRVINDIADKAKLEDMTFVVYGNPRLISLLSANVNWVSRVGSSSNGVKLDYGYGVMNSGDVKVQVISTKKCNIKKNGTVLDGIRIIPFPINEEQFTFKHYKYCTHILTSKDSAYRDARKPGGSYTYILGTSRYKNAEVQAIQSKINIEENGSYINGASIYNY